MRCAVVFVCLLIRLGIVSVEPPVHARAQLHVGRVGHALVPVAHILSIKARHEP
jgi:hypothetical protein